MTPKSKAVKAYEPPRRKVNIAILQPPQVEIIFDTETTGLLNNASMKADQQPKIIEFAAIKIDAKNYDILDEITFFANPGHPLDAKITQITGLTDADLKDEPPFAANVNKVADFWLGTRRVIGHNVWFDLDLLAWELVRLNMQRKFPWAPQPTCTIDMSYHIKGARMKQVDLYAHLFDNETYPAHRAMNDVLACHRNYVELRKREAA